MSHLKAFRSLTSMRKLLQQRRRRISHMTIGEIRSKALIGGTSIIKLQVCRMRPYTVFKTEELDRRL